MYNYFFARIEPVTNRMYSVILNEIREVKIQFDVARLIKEL